MDALHDGGNLRRVLEALGCDPAKDNGSTFESPGGFIHCPMPDHPDKHESVTVRADQGQMFCQSVCGPILPLDLIVAHGKAKDRGDAAKWVEQLLGIEPSKAPPAEPLIDDPSLTVGAYLARKGLPDWIAELFDLRDVSSWHPGADKDVKGAAYESGWYSSVLMPTRDGRRMRIRSDWPRTKLRWSTKVRQPGSALSIETALDAGGSALKLDAIGIDQLAPIEAAAREALGCAVLVVVEGESDVHAMHAMGLPCVVGLPGSKMGSVVAADLYDACVIAASGTTDLADLVVVVWQEPGSAGAAFPKHVAESIRDHCDGLGIRAPRFATLKHSAVSTHPKDPGALLLDRPAPVARQQMEAAILAALPAAGLAADIATPAAAAPAPATPPAGIQQPLEVLQVDGLHTPPPAHTSFVPVDTSIGISLGTELPSALPPGWSAESMAAAAEGETPAPPAYMEGPPPRKIGMAAPMWVAFDEVEDAPSTADGQHALELAPDRIDGIGSTFVRTDEGWSIEKRDKDGDTELRSICTAFVVEQVERCSGQILVRVAAPFGGAWNRTRLEMGSTADAGRTCVALGHIGVAVANRQRAAVTDLLLALTRMVEHDSGAVHVPAGTGWSGKPGTSQFGGIEVEPVNDFGARMFESNARRREAHPDTREAAMEWMRLASKLISAPEGVELRASHAAPLLAIGAAAAAPLIGPLADVGIAVAPVVWIAGLGGGGKSVTQKLAASIYAPALPDLDGQSAFFANANISQAALSARVDSCRDLPLILDDVTQLPPLPGSTSRGDAARIEAAAALGMMVFNRKPIERATRDGGIRQTRAFRSTAIFSAEVSMSSESSKAIVTAGHRRRIATIEAKPMTDRGLGQSFAESVNRIAATIGGAPGDLHIAGIREIVAAHELRSRFRVVRDALAALPEAAEVERTQLESLAVNVLGFELLCEHIAGRSLGGEPLRLALALLRAYLAAGAGAGGATRDSDLSGVDAALRSVDDLIASNPTRIDSQVRDDAGIVGMVPMQGYLGKEIKSLHDGTRRVVLLRPGMEMLSSRYGVTASVIEQASDELVCKPRYQFRMNGQRLYGTLWLLPPNAPDDEEEHDPTAPGPHDPDPHGLREIFQPAPVEPAAVRVPGMGSWVEEDPRVELEPVPANDFADSIAAHYGALTAANLAYQVATSKHFDGPEHSPSDGHHPRSFGDLERWARAGFEHTITYEHEGSEMDARFGWGSGLYKVGDGPAMRENPSLLKTIRMEARQELEALQMQYRHAAERDPDGRVDVADFPADDDPRWQVVIGLGAETLRAQWVAANEAIHAANHATDADAKRDAHRAHVKAYRVHLMGRYCKPEWFVEGTQPGRV